MMQNKKITTSKAFIALSSVTMVDKFVGFLYQAVFASLVGANILSDCYYSTFELLTLIDYSLVSAMSVALLKQYSSVLAESGELAGSSYLSKMRMLAVPFFAATSLLIVLFANAITYVLAPTYEPESRALLAQNIRYMAFVPMILAAGSFYLVILRQQKRFIVVGSKSLFINLVGFAALAFFVYAGGDRPSILCLGYNIAIVLYGIASFLASRSSVRLHFVKPRLDEDVRAFFRMLLPLSVSNGLMRFSSMVDRVISMGVGVGSATCLTYSQMLFNFVEGMFITNISTILLSDFTNLVAQGETEKMNNKVSNALSTMVLLLLPISIISVICSHDIAGAVFGHGRFTDESVQRVSSLLLVYAFGFVPSVISNIFIQVHYSFGETRRAMNISFITIALNIAVSLIGVSLFGLVGIAIGTSCSLLISAILSRQSAKRLLTGYRGIRDGRYWTRVLISGVSCTVAVWLTRSLCNGNYFLSFASSAIAGTIAYTIALVVEKEPIMLRYLLLLRKKLPFN